MADIYKAQGLKRIRNRVRLETSIVADLLLKAEDGFEANFEAEYDEKSSAGKQAFVTDEVDAWIKAQVLERFRPVLQPAIEEKAGDE